METVHFSMVPPAHEDLVLLFQCQVCKQKKEADQLLEHATSHGAKKATVDRIPEVIHR